MHICVYAYLHINICLINFLQCVLFIPRRSTDSDVCLQHQPIRLAKERELSVLNKRPRFITGDLLTTDCDKMNHASKTRISGSQNRMFNGLATPLVDLPLELDCNRMFKNKNLPVHIDIGCARGTFLIELAEMHPDKNFIGIEIRNKLVEGANNQIAFDKSQGKGNDNCIFICGNLLNESHLLQFENGLRELNINRISILFPDPWIKKKHQSRRVVQKNMLNSISNIICTGGELIIFSDVEDVMIDARGKLEQQCSELFTSISLLSLSKDIDSNENKFSNNTNENDNDNTTDNKIDNNISHSVIDNSKIHKLIDISEVSETIISNTIHTNFHNEFETYEVDNEGYITSNPFKPLSSEREQVCEITWRRVYRLIYIRK